jgi:hypothetical protein
MPLLPSQSTVLSVPPTSHYATLADLMTSLDTVGSSDCGPHRLLSCWSRHPTPRRHACPSGPYPPDDTSQYVWQLLFLGHTACSVGMAPHLHTTRTVTASRLSLHLPVGPPPQQMIPPQHGWQQLFWIDIATSVGITPHPTHPRVLPPGPAPTL